MEERNEELEEAVQSLLDTIDILNASMLLGPVSSEEQATLEAAVERLRALVPKRKVG